MLRANTNIRHNGELIIAGETFTAEEYKLDKARIQRWIDKGFVSESKPKPAKPEPSVSVTTVSEADVAAEAEGDTSDKSDAATPSESKPKRRKPAQ